MVVVEVTVDDGVVRKPVTDGHGGRTTVVVAPSVITIETELWAAARAGRRSGMTGRMIAAGTASTLLGIEIEGAEGEVVPATTSMQWAYTRSSEYTGRGEARRLWKQPAGGDIYCRTGEGDK